MKGCVPFLLSVFAVFQPLSLDQQFSITGVVSQSNKDKFIRRHANHQTDQMVSSMKYYFALISIIAAGSLLIGGCNSTKTNTSSQETTATAQQPSPEPVTAKPVEAATPAAYTVSQVVSVDAAKQGGAGTVGSVAPNFTWRGADGVQHSLAEYRGKTVLLNFWATWCPPCRRELPDLVRIHKSMDQSKVAIIGISLDQEAPQGMQVSDYVAEFSKRNELSYAQLIGNGDLVTAYGGIQAIPTTFIVNGDGKITEQLIGGKSEAVFRKSLESAM
jgi:thiol-disulfide isomerase/thioredoxin